MDVGYVSPFDLDNAWMGGKVKLAPAAALPSSGAAAADETASLAPGDFFFGTACSFTWSRLTKTWIIGKA